MFVNGFLGAGKTSAIAALCRIARDRGLRPAVISNDQARALVDSATFAAAGLPVAEVADGCFCCRFSDLVLAIDRLLAQKPDLVFCEAVGSCTDVVATVIRPLRRFYGDAILIAPFVVLVDASRARQLLIDEPSDDLRTLRRNQIAEADIVVLNKADIAAEIPLQGDFIVSARTGAGLPALLDFLLGSAESGGFPLREIDYDQYARAEAMLGWLNATATATSIVDGQTLVRDTVVQIAAAARPGDSIHVKARFGAALAQLTVAGDPPIVTGDQNSAGVLNLNARICADPQLLQRAFERIAAEKNLRIDAIQAFRPAYPHPEFRDAGGGA